MASIDTMGSIVVIAIVILMIAYLFIFSENDLRLATEAARADQVPHRRAFRIKCRFPIEHCEKSTICRHVKPSVYAAGPREGTLDTFKRRSTFQQGTVSTHRQRIYKKLGIHTKQELFDLIESRKKALASHLPKTC